MLQTFPQQIFSLLLTSFRPRVFCPSAGMSAIYVSWNLNRYDSAYVHGFEGAEYRLILAISNAAAATRSMRLTKDVCQDWFLYSFNDFE